MATSFASLLDRRWAEACAQVPGLSKVPISWSFEDRLHFQTPRGFALTGTDGARCWFVFAKKIEKLDELRADAIVRHEIGHVVDLAELVVWKGLPLTPERRADAIAQRIWGVAIRYDDNDIQTLGDGRAPRPERLGL
jgi:hypothetical protein